MLVMETYLEFSVSANLNLTDMRSSPGAELLSSALCSSILLVHGFFLFQSFYFICI